MVSIDRIEKVSDRLESALETTWEVRSYSGRAMFGKECLGVVLDSERDQVRLGAMLQQEFGDDDTEALIRDLHIDSLGLDLIAYFPSVQLEAFKGKQ
jgi:hypothetical protein